jgi:ferredoxin
MLPRPKIVFDHKKCIKCGKCRKNCPVNVIELGPYPVCEHSGCIRCFCCIEICPESASGVKQSKITLAARKTMAKLRKLRNDIKTRA